MRTGVRSSFPVAAGPSTGVLRVSRKVQRRFGPVLRPQIPARQFASTFGLTLSSVSRDRLVLRDVENRSRQDWIDAVRRAGVARSRFVSSLRDRGFLQPRRRSSDPLIGNNPKQLAADELRGCHCPRRSELNDSDVTGARRADTRWRNEELFVDILRQRVAQSLIDSARLAGVEHRRAGGLFPGNDLGQNNPEKIFIFNQLLTRKAQSHLRVICATPF